MEVLDAYAVEPHFRDHILPVWEALPGRLRGTFYTGRSPGQSGRPQGRGPIIVAGYNDLKRVAHRPVAFLEHGAGQHYSNGHPSYAGGRGRAAVQLFLCPNETVAARNRAVYPAADHAVVGCPKLDPWWNTMAQAQRPTVAISFHWEASQCPESRSAFPHYASVLPRLAAAGWRILGHGHPRKLRNVIRYYAKAGIEVVPEFSEVLRQAHVYVCDNSSTLYEFAATGRPVVVMNAPWYRRDVHHGLRFWEYADIGIQVDGPDQLLAAITDAFADTPERQSRRSGILACVYQPAGPFSRERTFQELSRWLEQRAGKVAA